MKWMALIALAAGGCTTTQDAGRAPAPALPVDNCDTSILAALVGKPFSASLEAQATKESGLTTIRVIRPGMAVTMDFRPDRLNIDLDEKNVVTGFRCG